MSTNVQKAPTGAKPKEESGSSGSNGASGPDPRFGEMPPELAALDDDVVFDADALPSLAEVGRVLPIGYRDQTGKVHREFSLVDWDWDLEEELGELAEKEEDMSMGVYVSEVIGRGLERLGDVDFTKLKRSQRRLVVSNLYFSDALFIYIWIRIGALGEQLRLEKFKCAKTGCRNMIDYVGDLRTLEVKVATGEDGVIPTKKVTLPRPITYAGADRKVVSVGPLRWAFMETDDETTLTNPAKFRKSTMDNGVVHVEGAPEGPVRFSRENLKQLGSKGVNLLVGEIDEIGGGAVMQIEGKCHRCKTEFLQAVDWSYADFFGRSSR